MKVIIDGNDLTPLPPADQRWMNAAWLADKSKRGLPKPLPQEVLSACAAEAQRLGRPLSDSERDSIYASFD